MSITNWGTEYSFDPRLGLRICQLGTSTSSPGLDSIDYIERGGCLCNLLLHRLVAKFYFAFFKTRIRVYVVKGNWKSLSENIL